MASATSSRPVHLLEKDVWVVWALETLFGSPLGPHLVFKGGTSLSKAYQAIRRFSEDVDLTYDIRAIAPDLVAAKGDTLPSNPSQKKKWSKEIKSRLLVWVMDKPLPLVEAALTAAHLPACASANGEKIHIRYEPLATGSGYVSPVVTLEFGAQSTGEPCEPREIKCDAATCFPNMIFPTASPRVMRIERTFWEKATAIHVFCVGGGFRGKERFARHWHDVARLNTMGYADQAIADRGVPRGCTAKGDILSIKRWRRRGY
jgi:hypothetical protein